MFMKVDLPLPEAPTTATNAPFSISSVTPRRAWTVTSPSVWVLRRSITRTPGGAPAAELTAASLPALLGPERLGLERVGAGSAARPRPRPRPADVEAGDDRGP